MTIITRALAGTAALALLSTAPALAHVTLEVAEAPADSTYKAVMRVPHGCGEQPTNAVTVTMPEGFIDVKPMPKAGWTLETGTSDYAKTYMLWGSERASGVTTLRWSGGALPSGYYDEFVFRGRVTDLEPGTSLPFKVVQTCPDGEAAWTEIAAPGTDAHALEHPAPALIVAAAKTETGHAHSAHANPQTPAEDHAHGPVTAGNLTLATPWMRQPPPGANVAGGYVTITNMGNEADTLIGGSAPFAKRFEVHEMAMKDGMMTMKEVAGGLQIAPGATVKLAPGGYHLMLMGLSEAPQNGEMVPLTLEFENASTVSLMMQVAPMGAQAPAENHGSHEGHMAQ
ncbi:DUF1775 domain-containing protein [Acuticoccus sp. MNP-M23]|uniref:DUF1775 domain-containing protein n=1 Tax=Acuticoccus sp. MNP-M23 TaxID=3072793 RepID=UPI00281640A3|nr:DUF1775 domain-containing protein [Acuticoccus sp. MNP-M23]WMS43238.1 DUF1775 domain-containing protein [Acuticoccus sp. MNP-M23]